MKIFLIAGARPNFMKIAPIVGALRMHRNQKSEVGDQRSEVRDQRSEVRSQISEDRGQKSDIGGQISEDRKQKSEVGRQKSEVGRQKANDLSWKIVHTGQHYDYDMSQAFLEEREGSCQGHVI